jgi:hypothetical protein
MKGSDYCRSNFLPWGGNLLKVEVRSTRRLCNVGRALTVQEYNYDHPRLVRLRY